MEWWSSTYESLANGDGALSELLAGRGVKPKEVEETAREMLTAS